ncbi:hypothetical protein FACS1894132_07230 [Clostridia bacterium]|nr:hypothetical protein FACS1894132_07230 [Clostridia bacterium]
MRNNEDSEEVVNDTLMKLYETGIPPDVVNMQAFVGKITRNKALNRLDKNKRTINTTPLEEIQDVISTVDVEKDELLPIINKFLENLPKEQRAIFLRRYYGNEEILEIANAENFSESNVKQILFRLRKKLKKVLESEGLL